MAPARWTAQDADDLRQAVGNFVRVGRGHDVIPRPQSTVLGCLDREGALTVAELAGRAGVRHQTMRVTVAALEKACAIVMSRSESDGRKVICALTDQGFALLERDRDARTAWILDGLGRLGPEQQGAARQISGILEALAAQPSSGA